MFRALRRTVPALLLLCLGAGTAFADLAKLDPRARTALALIRQGGSPESLKDRGAALTREGLIDAFVAGPVSRFELEAAGAIVRSEVPGIFTAYIPESAIEAVAAAFTTAQPRPRPKRRGYSIEGATLQPAV